MRELLCVMLLILASACQPAEEAKEVEQQAQPVQEAQNSTPGSESATSDYTWPEKLATVESRKQFWCELTAAEHRAQLEAEAKYPTGDLIGAEADAQFQRQTKLMADLVDRYTTEILEKWNATEEYVKQIVLDMGSSTWEPCDWDATTGQAVRK